MKQYAAQASAKVVKREGQLDSGLAFCLGAPNTTFLSAHPDSSVQTIYVDFDVSCFVPVNFFMH